MISIDLSSSDAASRLVTAASSGGEVRLHNGQVSLSAPLMVSPRTRILGEGPNCRLLFTSPGMGVSLAHDSATNASGDSSLEGVTVATVAGGTGFTDAIEIQGGARQRVADIIIEGAWSSGITLDGAELCSIERVTFGNPGIGVWFADLTRAGGFTVGGATNVNWLDRLHFTGPATPIRHDGGAGNSARRMYGVAPGPIIVRGGTGLVLEEYWGESPAGEIVRFEYVGDSRLVHIAPMLKRIRGGNGTSPLVTMSHLSVLKGLHLEGCVATTSVALFSNAGAYLDGPVIDLGNQNWGTGTVFDAPHAGFTAVSVSAAYYNGTPFSAFDRIV